MSGNGLDNSEFMPTHVAFIMDGNGRWAKSRGKPRLFGHHAGTENVKNIVMESLKLGITYVTFYAFSTENWKRAEDEVMGLMKLMVKFINSEIQEINENNIKLNIFGDMDSLPKASKNALLSGVELTKNNTAMMFNLAINYGGRDEIIRAVKHIAIDVKNDRIDEKMIDEAVFETYLYSANMPDPDLMIRTSGEERISNFLLWQLAYSEFVFSKVYWPDFSVDEYHNALKIYQSRNRRFGRV